jgi:isoleucyl-tRNA synthetase
MKLKFATDVRLWLSVNLTGHEIIIWTTTPWTMPGNRAVAYGKDIEYP